MTDAVSAASDASSVALSQRSRWRIAADLILILSGSIFTGLLTVAPAPVLPKIAEHFGGDARFLAQIIGVFPAIGVVIAGPLIGGMIDRFGVRRVLLFSTASYAVLGVLGMFLENVTVLMVSRFLLGMAGSGIYGATFTLAGERYAGTRLAFVLGYKGAAGAGGSTLAILAAGSLAQAFGWRSVFSLYLIAGIAFLLALGVQGNIRPRRTEQKVVDLAPLIRMWPMFLLMILVFAATYTTVGQGAFLLKANGVELASAKYVIASGSFSYMIGSAIYGILRKFFGAQVIFRTGLLFVGLGSFGAGLLTSSSLETAACFAMAGFGNGLAAPYLHSMVLERTPATVRGLASGLVSPTHYAGEFLNPFFFAVFMLAGGIHAAFLILGVIMAVAMYFLRPDAWRLAGDKPAAAPLAQAPAQ